jgi:hypothetical protein
MKRSARNDDPSNRKWQDIIFLPVFPLALLGKWLFLSVAGTAKDDAFLMGIDLAKNPKKIYFFI